MRLSKFFCVLLVPSCSFWGFFAHQQINKLAVFSLPAPMIGFYKANLSYLIEAAVNPDRRRYAVAEEGARHFIDLDGYNDSALLRMPRTWRDVQALSIGDSMKRHGIVPWHIPIMYRQLTDAFLRRDAQKILRLSAELGHYVSDAHVPLHTTSNYDGQKSNQSGIHAFWESRLPELFSTEYDFFVGPAMYCDDVVQASWDAVLGAHCATDSVLGFEQEVGKKLGHRKFSFESRGTQTIKVVSRPYASRYHQQLAGMVERQMRASIKMTADLWFSAWVDAGQPDLSRLQAYKPDEKELADRAREVEEWKKKIWPSRPHEEEAVIEN